MTARVPMDALNATQALGGVTRQWDEAIVPRLKEYIAVPAKSPSFDPDWAKNGYIDRVIRDAATWVESQKVEGLKLEVI